MLRILVFSVRSHAVRRAVHHERDSLRSILWDIDGGEEVHAVTHGNAVLVLCVMCLDVVFFGGGGLFLRGRKRKTGDRTPG